MYQQFMLLKLRKAILKYTFISIVFAPFLSTYQTANQYQNTHHYTTYYLYLHGRCIINFDFMNYPFANHIKKVDFMNYLVANHIKKVDFMNYLVANHITKFDFVNYLFADHINKFDFVNYLFADHINKFDFMNYLCIC